MSCPDYVLGETIDYKFTTRQFSSGAPFALASGAAEVYEDNDLAQITVGETLTLEFDGVTGLHNLRLVLTGANGYETGKSYTAVISVGTVDSVSVVGEVILNFTIQRSPVNWAKVSNPTTALDLSGTDIQLVDTCTVNIDVRGTDSAALASVCTESRLAELDGANLPTDIAAIPTTAMRGTDGVDTATMRGTDSAALASVATEARLAELDGANLPTTTDNIETDTQDIQGRLPSALIGGRMDSDVEAINNSTVAAIQLALSAAEIESGAFEATPTVSTLQTNLAEPQDDIYIGRVIIITSGAARGEATDIIDYTGATGTLEVTDLSNAPAATDTFILI